MKVDKQSTQEVTTMNKTKFKSFMTAMVKEVKRDGGRAIVSDDWRYVGTNCFLYDTDTFLDDLQKRQLKAAIEMNADKIVVRPEDDFMRVINPKGDVHEMLDSKMRLERAVKKKVFYDIVLIPADNLVIKCHNGHTIIKVVYTEYVKMAKLINDKIVLKSSDEGREPLYIFDDDSVIGAISPVTHNFSEFIETIEVISDKYTDMYIELARRDAEQIAVAN
jgi:hypothetical protein